MASPNLTVMGNRTYHPTQVRQRRLSGTILVDEYHILKHKSQLDQRPRRASIGGSEMPGSWDTETFWWCNHVPLSTNTAPIRMPKILEVLKRSSAESSLFLAGRHAFWISILLRDAIKSVVYQMARKVDEDSMMNEASEFLVSKVEHLVQDGQIEDSFFVSDDEKNEQMRTLAAKGLELAKQLFTLAEAIRLTEQWATEPDAAFEFWMDFTGLLGARWYGELLIALGDNGLHSFRVVEDKDWTPGRMTCYRVDPGQTLLPGQKVWDTADLLDLGLATGFDHEYCDIPGLFVHGKADLDVVALSNPLPTGEDCSICTLELRSGVVRTTCQHRIHEVCLQEWAKTEIVDVTDITCPHCRTNLGPKGPMIEVYKTGKDDANEPRKWWLQDEAEWWERCVIRKAEEAEVGVEEGVEESVQGGNEEEDEEGSDEGVVEADQ